MTLATAPLPETLLISQDMSVQRIDKLLTAHYPTFSRTYFQRIIEEGFVLLNGEPVRKRIIPEPGDEIEVCFPLPPESALTPEPIFLDILYEDDHLIAINKPAGLVVHPAPGHPNGTFVNALLHHCQNLPTTDPLRPGIVHRLDRETTGVLIAAKTSQAHQKLVEAFAARKIKKTYLALCLGCPPNTTVAAPIGRNPTQRKEMAVVETRGKTAVSRIQVLATNRGLSLVLIQPETGRTHQIRVHLKHLGHPVLGDTVYGNAGANETHRTERHLLHAYRLELTHPLTEAPLTLIAPLPADLCDKILLLTDSLALP